MSERERRLLSRLEETLREDREPPPERVRALREQADARRRAAAEAPPARRELARRQFLLGGAATAMGAALGVGVYALADSEPDALLGPPTEPIALIDVRPGVVASAELISHEWGVETILEVDGLRPGSAYELVYRATDQREVLAGTFLAVEGTISTCRMTGALRREETTTIVLRERGGDVVLRSQLV